MSQIACLRTGYWMGAIAGLFLAGVYAGRVGFLPGGRVQVGSGVCVGLTVLMLYSYLKARGLET
jgi:hypothetical protein